MPAILFICPTSHLRIQQWLPDDGDASDRDYEGIVCATCTRIHFVNRIGKVAGAGTRMDA
jgi:hypothetical protein